MKNNELNAIGWILGFFALSYPIIYILHGKLITGLLNGILGVSGAILILILGDKEK